MDFEQFKLIINLLQDAGNLVLRVEEPTIRMAIDAARKGEAEVAALRAELAELQAMYEQQGFTIKRQQDELARREEQLSGAMDKINLYERYAMRAIRDLEPYQQANPKLQSLWQRAKNLSTDAARKGEGEVC